MRSFSMVSPSFGDQDLSDDYDEDVSSPAETESAAAAVSTTPEDWKDAINRVVPAVVVLRVTASRSFDTDFAGSYSATGFVVDKLRGLILTNRHVVMAGPVVAQAIFVNHEEITVYPLYRDPVHDFGFYRFDPGAIKHLEYEEIPLAPEAAHVGLEIRVVGNDSSEKVSILAGTLSRMDRGAPTYKKDGYNDFNTFYIQAASGTKGGSSGSPVINRQGWAVALNAGSKTSSSSAFYLPLDRVVRALKYLQKGRDFHMDKLQAVHIPRGTLQVTFRHEGFDETRRLGLQSETEQMVRHASSLGETGMLVVESTVPDGPACDLLEPGDVLVRVNGEVTTQFLKLETILDDSVDQKIELQIERGGAALAINIVVQDLHSITPDYFLEISGTVMHPLSYQQARNFGFQCGLVYVANPGYMLQRAGVPRHAIIKTFASVETPQVEQVISVLPKLSRGSRVPLEYITHKDRHQWKAALVTIDRHEWYDAPKIYSRDDSSGIWIPRLAIPPASLPGSSSVSHGERVLISHIPPIGDETNVEGYIHQDNNQVQIDASSYAHSREENIVKTSMQQVEGQLSASGIDVNEWLSTECGQTNLEDSSSTGHADSNDIACMLVTATNASLAECTVEPCLVLVEANVPPSCLLDGVDSQRTSGTGIILHHSHDMGLVAVDKNTVKVSAVDIMLSFAAFPIEIPGEVVFLHPVYNYALVCYNPSLLGVVGFSKVRPAELLPEPTLCRGDQVHLVGLTRYLRAKSRKSTVTNACVTLKNTEVIELDSDFGSKFTGVLCNKQGKIQALWGSFSNEQKIRVKDNQFIRGIPIYVVSQILDKIVSGAKGKPLLINGVHRTMPFVRNLEVQLYPVLLSKARSFGLTDDWILALAEKDALRQQVLRVKGCLAGSKADNLLKAGDMLLAVNKNSVTCYRDLENYCQAIDECSDSDGKLSITVFRQGCEVDLLVGTDVRDGNGTTRTINWCGCLVQHPQPAVRALGFLPKEGHGVYVTSFHRGSPADRYGLRANRWIVEVNGKRTPDLDALVNVTKELGIEEFVRVKTINLDAKPSVLTLKQDLHYWPTWELRFDPDTAMWRRKTIKALDHSNL